MAKGKPPETGITNLLIQEDPLLVLPSLAVAVGLNEAIFLQQIHFHLRFSRNERDGKTWVYNTFEDWQKEMPWWSVSTLKRIVYKLQSLGLLITTSEYNKMPIDKTLWYTIDYSVVVSLRNTDVSNWYVDRVNLTRPSSQLDTMCRTNLTRPITKEDPKIYNKDLAAAALPSPLVNVDRFDRNSIHRDHARTSLHETADATLRRVAAAFAAASFPHGGFSGLAEYIDTLPDERLRTFCAWCYYSDLAAGKGDTAIRNYAAFVRRQTDKGERPGFSDAEAAQFEALYHATVDGRDIWEESRESEFNL